MASPVRKAEIRSKLRHQKICLSRTFETKCAVNVQKVSYLYKNKGVEHRSENPQTCAADVYENA